VTLQLHFHNAFNSVDRQTFVQAVAMQTLRHLFFAAWLILPTGFSLSGVCPLIQLLSP
jgi:hypothetical protein